MTARPIRHNAQVPDRNGKIFYTSITSLSHISKSPRIPAGAKNDAAQNKIAIIPHSTMLTVKLP